MVARDTWRNRDISQLNTVYKKNWICIDTSSLVHWRRGSAVEIRWKCQDPIVTEVKIEIGCHAFASAMTCVVRSTKNMGVFLYPKIPWGMPIRKDYFLRFTPLNTKMLPLVETVPFAIGN